MAPLNDEQLDRYARHIVLRDIGGAGQAKLLAAHMLVIGAGGIGNPALQYLAAAGVGKLTIVDDDVVSLSNLQRQTLFGVDDIGQPKVACVAKALSRINPDCAVMTVQARISADFGAALFEDIDLVLDGSDNFATRLIINDLAVAAKVPLVSAAIGQFHGQLGTFMGHQADAPCYRCFVGDAHDPDDCDSCAELGVLGAMVGVMGSYAAMEAIRVVTGFGEAQKGKLHIIDGLTPSMRTIKLPKDPECRTCSLKGET
jgi:molybdopterin-synthase adenylyltransferase